MNAQSALGLILDGGLGRRMGGADKGLMLLAGRPMLAHVIERLAPQCGRLAISANGDPARLAAFGLPVVSDEPQNYAGPLAGVLAGLELASRIAPGISHVATAPADAPFLPQDFVSRLGAALAPNGSDDRRRRVGRTEDIPSPRFGRSLSRALCGRR